MFCSLALPVPSCIGECDGVSAPSGQLCLLNHSVHTHKTRTLTLTLPLIALARVEQDRIRSALCCVALHLHKHSNIFSTCSEHSWRMPVAVARSDDVMHEPWAEGLAEHAPSTATQNARMHTYTCTHTHSRILSCCSKCTWVFSLFYIFILFCACKWIDC